MPMEILSTSGWGSIPAPLVLAAPKLALAAVLVVAAAIDARSRRFPNSLAACAAATGAVAAVWPVLLTHGAPAPPASSVGELLARAAARLLAHAAPAALAAVALTALEAGWRSRRGGAGIGMGDVKLLFALMLADPVSGLASFAAALALLAPACVLARRPSLPLIPFIALTWLPTLLL